MTTKLAGSPTRMAKLRAALMRTRAVWLAPLASFVLASLVEAAAATPSTAFVSAVQQNVVGFGRALLLLTIGAGILVSVFSREHSLRIDLAGVRRAAMLALPYAACVWGIGAWGDSVYLWALAEPTDAGSVLVALLLLGTALILHWVLFSVPPGRDNIEGALGVASEIPPAPTFESRALSARDVRLVAAHEAGHAFAYAALERLPRYVHVSVQTHPGKDRALGFVTGIMDEHFLRTRAFAEWQMLMLLSGQVAERFLEGTETVGSTDDHARWLKIAAEYLMNQFAGVYFCDPTLDSEIRSNVSKLELLKREQIALLEEVFERNSTRLRLMAAELREARELSNERLAVHLAAIVLPEGFPRPTEVAPATDEPQNQLNPNASGASSPSAAAGGAHGMK